MKIKVNQLIAVLSITAVLSSCGSKEEARPEQLRPVKFMEVENLESQEIRTFSGSAATDKIIPLSFRNSGIITELNLKLGQQVKKGQFLARLDNVQARLSYESAVEDLNSAASQMNTAKLSLNRVKSLYEKGSTSLSDYESAKNSYVTSVASYESAKRSVEIQKEKINYGYLIAPENGVISKVSAEIEENVSSGQEIGVLNAGTNMEIRLGMPESVINGVKNGMRVSVSFSSLKDKIFDAEVSEVSPSIDVNTSTYPVKVTILNPSDEIKTGMSANVTFSFEINENIIASLKVPANAVGEDANGKFVFVISESNGKSVVNKRPIKIGDLTPEGFEVVSGVQAGERIATAGLQTLLDGQEVKLN